MRKWITRSMGLIRAMRRRLTRVMGLIRATRKRITRSMDLIRAMIKGVCDVLNGGVPLLIGFCHCLIPLKDSYPNVN
jgi:hypothetical protein